MDKNRIGQGMHIGFTGIDGTGKSTQAALLCGWLTQKGIPNILRERKRGFVSEMASAIARTHGIEDGRKYLGEDYYMVALSFDLLREVVLDIHPFTGTGTIVVSTRTAFCRLAGGIARRYRSIELATEIALFGGIPDLTIWLDVSPEIAYQRITQRGFDSADLEHLERYRKALKELLQNYPHTIIDGEKSIEIVQAEVRKVVESALKLRRIIVRGLIPD